MTKKEENKQETIDGTEPKKEPKKHWTEGMTKYSLNNSIVALFDKTPEPKEPWDVSCPHFWELKYANGCRYSCSWCFLNGTYRFDDVVGTSPRHKDPDEIVKHLEWILEAADEPILFNAGEVADAQLYPVILLRNIIPLFKKYQDKGHRLLLLTKDDTKEVMNKAEAQSCVTFAYSINAERVAEDYELEAPTPIQRLAAAGEAHRIGYNVRLRLDPMVPVSGWKEAYTHIIKEIMRLSPNAEVITLGSLRGLQSTITACKKRGKDMDWVQYLTENSNWGKRPGTEISVEMYTHAVTELRRLGYKGEIALCKETLEIWERMKPLLGERGSQRCNCIL